MAVLWPIEPGGGIIAVRTTDSLAIGPCSDRSFLNTQPWAAR